MNKQRIQLLNVPLVILLFSIVSLARGGEQTAPRILSNSYVGREPDAAWRLAAAERIDEHRKGDLIVCVVNADGQPIAGASVDARMKRHAFHLHDPRWATRVAFTYDLLKKLNDQDVPVHGLGLQSHHVGSLAPIPEVIKTLDRFATLGLELQVTEYDIRLVPSTDDPKADYRAKWRQPMRQPPTAEMEQLEADYLRDYLTACFSHPSVSGFVMWGFRQGRHWLYNSPLLREDWTPKPAGKVWSDLVFNQWWTHSQAQTDNNGTAKIRGFLGDYEITVTKDGRLQKMTASLPKPGREIRLVMK